MVIKLAGGLFHSGLFQQSPEDGQTLIWDGYRWIAGNVEDTIGTQTASTGTCLNDNTVGAADWINLTLCTALDGNCSGAPKGGQGGAIENSIKLAKAGTITGSEKSLGRTLNPGTITYINYGSSSDLWGTTWTPAQINDANFGVAFSELSANGVTSHYLKSKDFGFAIPTSATILGIFARIAVESWVGQWFCIVDHIEITITYKN